MFVTAKTLPCVLRSMEKNLTFIQIMNDLYKKASKEHSVYNREPIILKFSQNWYWLVWTQTQNYIKMNQRDIRRAL